MDWFVVILAVDWGLWTWTNLKIRESYQPTSISWDGKTGVCLVCLKKLTCFIWYIERSLTVFRGRSNESDMFSVISLGFQVFYLFLGGAMNGLSWNNPVPVPRSYPKWPQGFVCGKLPLNPNHMTRFLVILHFIDGPFSSFLLYY